MQVLGPHAFTVSPIAVGDTNKVVAALSMLESERLRPWTALTHSHQFSNPNHTRPSTATLPLLLLLCACTSCSLTHLLVAAPSMPPQMPSSAMHTTWWQQPGREKVRPNRACCSCWGAEMLRPNNMQLTLLACRAADIDEVVRLQQRKAAKQSHSRSKLQAALHSHPPGKRHPSMACVAQFGEVINGFQPRLKPVLKADCKEEHRGEPTTHRACPLGQARDANKERTRGRHR